VSGFGDRLRQAREARGATLESIAGATRIQRRHLEALEGSDLGALPAATFVKGYIRAYADSLAIDPQPILEAYRSELQGRGLDAPEARDRVIEELSAIVARRAESTGARPWPPGRRALRVALGLVAVALVATGGWLLSRSRAPQPAPVPATTPRTAETETPRSALRPAVPATATDRGSRRAPSRAALRVADSGVGAGVTNHRLVGRADRFAEGTQVAFWTHVTGGEAGDVVRHVWFHQGQAVMRANLEIGGAQWRTYSRRLLPKGATGDWVVEARGPDGGLLARQEFLCVPDEP
jgi:hypothetical protein